MKSIKIFLFVGVAIIALCNCQSDTPAASDTSSGQNIAAPMADNETDNAIGQDPAQDKARLIARAQDLESQTIQFQKKVYDLQQQVNLIPAAWKSSASDYSDLEARLDGYMEKGAYVQDEIKKVLEQMAGTSGSSNQDSEESNYAGPLEEQATNLKELQKAGIILDQAVEKLKNSAGKKIRLFED